MPRKIDNSNPINIPLNVDRWSAAKDAERRLLVWFHQYCLDNKITPKQAANFLDYDPSTINKLLHGVYPSYAKPCGRISDFKEDLARKREIEAERSTIKTHNIVENSIARYINNALKYALSNNTITLITGESRMGKTAIAEKWKTEHNHGTSVYVVAPVRGGVSALLRRIAEALGHRKNHSVAMLEEKIYEGFDHDRILIVDEAHRLLPKDKRSDPSSLETLRDLHDATKCGLAFIATNRFDATLRKSSYMYEQILGRVGMPVTLPARIKWADIKPIVNQFIEEPSLDMRRECQKIANEPGRLGILIETLKVASQVAHKRQVPLDSKIFFQALALRQKMMGKAL